LLTACSIEALKARRLLGYIATIAQTDLMAALKRQQPGGPRRPAGLLADYFAKWEFGVVDTHAFCSI